MKDLFYKVFAGISIIFIFGAVFNECTNDKTTLPNSMTIQEVVYLKEELRRCQDSLRIIRTDSTMSSELFVAKYKLERIRYYNDIAGKGNNIKYIRGWINRVLNE